MARSMMKHKIDINYDKNINNDLTNLCVKYGSDKGSFNDYEITPFGWKYHKYTDVYNMLFNHSREYFKNVFEVGLGTNNPNIKSNMTVNGKPGASLRMWRDYFKNAQIFGADIDRNILFEEDRVKTFYVDQLDPKSIEQMWSQIDVEFDVILDDGLHTAEANLCFFKNSFHKLKDNGIYIIEDIVLNNANIICNYLNDNNHHFMYLDLTNSVPNLDDRIIIVFKDKGDR
jgi:hypothetical protein